MLTTQVVARTNSGHGGGLSVPGQTSLLLRASPYDEIRQAPGALATTQNHLQCHQQARCCSLGLSRSLPKMAFTRGDQEVQASVKNCTLRFFKY
eukprot:198016-Pelagomonas_calceolata.AAC.8